MSRSYHNVHRDSDDDHSPKKQIPPKRTQKREIKIQRVKQTEWERYIDKRNLEREISFQVAGIIAKSLQVIYDDSIKRQFVLEKIFINNKPPHFGDWQEEPFSNEIKKEVGMALAWIIQDVLEEEKKLRSIEICYNQDHT